MKMDTMLKGIRPEGQKMPTLIFYENIVHLEMFLIESCSKQIIHVFSTELLHSSNLTKAWIDLL